MIFPFAGDAKLTSLFGPRNVDGIPSNHTGIDFALPVGTALFAAERGTVTKAQKSGGYGLAVYIDCGNGLQLIYAHLSQAIVRQGDQVNRGVLIGYSGGAKGDPNAGSSTGPHLHFETRMNGKAVNPLPYLRKEEEEMTLEQEIRQKVDGITEVILNRPINDGDKPALEGRTKMVLEGLAKGVPKHQLLNELFRDISENAINDDKTRVKSLLVDIANKL